MEKVREPEDRLPETGTSEGSLTAIISSPTIETDRPLIPQIHL